MKLATEYHRVDLIDAQIISLPLLFFGWKEETSKKHQYRPQVVEYSRDSKTSVGSSVHTELSNRVVGMSSK